MRDSIHERCIMNTFFLLVLRSLPVIFHCISAPYYYYLYIHSQHFVTYSVVLILTNSLNK